MRRKCDALAVIALSCCSATSAAAQARPPAIATTSAEADPILKLREQQVDEASFRAAIRATVARHPATAEAAATQDEARYGVSGARQQLLPKVDVTLSSYRVIARNFSNDPFNIIERSRPHERTDGLVSVQQTLFDFGATSKQIRSAIERYKGAHADAENAAGQIAVSAISAWYDVFGYRALTALAESFLADQRRVRAGMQERIQSGVSSESDLAGVDSGIARAQTRLAGYTRGLANAEARFEELTGAPAPAQLARAPVPSDLPRNREDAAALGRTIATARSADATAAAEASDAKVALAQRLPSLTGGVDAGRYGVVENRGDYDVRGTVTLRHRLLGGATAAIHQAEARARAAGAHADRVREEGSRDAAIAFSDVHALTVQLDALQAAYVAARRSRDATFERFTASRGTLFDILSAQEGYFDNGAAFVQGLVDLDAARYVLLARTDRLLPQLGIAVERMRGTQ